MASRTVSGSQRWPFFARHQPLKSMVQNVNDNPRLNDHE
jgi:hypothetical protein